MGTWGVVRARSTVGEPFLFARESYGEEFTLQFGREVDLPPFRGLRLTEVSHVLCFRASVWRVKSVPWESFVSGEVLGAGPGVTPVTLHDLETRAVVTPGSRVSAIEARAFHGVGWPGGIELALRFGDDSFLDLRPQYDPANAVSDLADWELFTPYNRCVRAGPGVV